MDMFFVTGVAKFCQLVQKLSRVTDTDIVKSASPWT